MLNKKNLQKILPVGDFGQVMHFHKRIGSTNDEALKLAHDNASHGTLIVADEQTKGRGRKGRHWSTPPGSAVAMSLVLRPEQFSSDQVGELTVLGALATVEAIESLGGLARIKWPNDILLNGSKIAGVLVEGGWVENQLVYAVMGLGINARPGAVQRKERFDFPASSLEDEMGQRVDRVDVIRRVLECLSARYALLGSGELIAIWQEKLAYKDEMVTVQGPQMKSTGKLVGITNQGHLRLQLPTGEVLQIGVGAQQLRPVDRN